MSKNVGLFRAHFRPKTEADEELLREIEIATENQPKPKIQKTNEAQPTLTQTATAPTPSAPVSSNPTSTVSQSDERLPSGAPAVFKDFKFPEKSEPCVFYTLLL